MTNVDFDFLSEKTGQKILTEHMLDIRDRQTMRVITDFLAGSNPVDAVANGRYWLDKVYEAGYEAGARNARMKREGAREALRGLPPKHERLFGSLEHIRGWDCYREKVDAAIDALEQENPNAI